MVECVETSALYDIALAGLIQQAMIGRIRVMIPTNYYVKRSFCESKKKVKL